MKKTTHRLIGTSLLSSILFLGCQENTKEPIITDIQSIHIDTNISYIYATDTEISLSATVVHTDNTTGDASEGVLWQSSDSSIASLELNKLSGGIKNGGDVTISINYEDLYDTHSIKVIKLLDFNISHGDINTTGEHILEAIGFFEDNSSKKILGNITWDANNSATFREADNLSIIDLKAGTTHVSAILFADNEDINLTKSVLFTIE